MQNGLCNMNEFSVDEYEYYEKVENGDWNWITPGFIAFASPVDNAWIAKQNGDKSSKHSALQRRLPIPFQNCLDYFEKKHVKIVVRLNQPLYDRQVFLDRGIDHMELYFDDGTNPTDEIVRTFINVADAVTSKGGTLNIWILRIDAELIAGVVAVHCKAGLGRTGTLIGAYLIWKYGFTANEAIAFMRIVRPGSVVGPQQVRTEHCNHWICTKPTQHYMYLKQLEWNKWAAADEVRRAAESQAEENGRVTPDMQIDKLPPVTPSRHVLATTAAVQEIANPPQPRKTPRSKRTVVEDMMDEDVPTLNLTFNEEERDHSGPLPPSPMKPLSRPAPTRRPVSRAAANGPTATSTSPSSTPSGRQTRSVTAKASANQTATSSPTTRAAGAVLGGRIPRLARAKDTDSALPSSMTTRSRTAGKPPPPETPSRLPKPRIPAKRTYVTLEMDSGNESGPTDNTRASATNGRVGASSPTGRSTRRKSAGAKLRLVEDPSTSTEWVSSQEAVAVVEPAAKGGRPSLRNVKRRRSSFSSADVVA